MTNRLTSAISDLGTKISHKLSQSGDASYFQTNPRSRGMLQELREGLSSASNDKRISALKKIIALMSNGKDVSSLFPEVISCMQSNNISQKKLVYIYIVNTSVSRPNVAILAVNTFRNDCQDPNPLIRALALRTMASMQLKKILPYLIDPIKNGLTDSDPYCRRTAVMAVAKAYQTCPKTILDEGFHDKLCEKLRDQNAAVVASAISALKDIAVRSNGKVPFEIRRDMVPPLLETINGCSAWGQLNIMEALALYYRPRTPREAQAIIERCAPRLQHANTALVLAAVRVIVLFLPLTNIEGAQMDANYEKLMPPLVSLLSLEPEVQFVALKTIATLIDLHPNHFRFDPSVFYYPYNDPPYIKRMKVECLVRLVNEENVRTVVGELQDCIHDVNPSIARYAVISIGRIGCYFATREESSDSISEFCVDVMIGIVEAAHSKGVRQDAILSFEKLAKATKNLRILECVEKVGFEYFGSDSGLTSLEKAKMRNSICSVITTFYDQVENIEKWVETLFPIADCDEGEIEIENTVEYGSSIEQHVFVTMMFRILSDKDLNSSVEEKVLTRLDNILKNHQISLDVRERVAMLLHLYRKDLNTLRNMLDHSINSVVKTKLVNDIPDKMRQVVLMNIGSVVGMHISHPSTLDVTDVESPDEDSEEDAAPLVAKQAAVPPSTETLQKQEPSDFQDSSIDKRSDISRNVRDSSNDNIVVKAPLKFDDSWEGLSKEGFIHRWHQYSGMDAFSFGRLPANSATSLGEIHVVLSDLGLKFVKDRKEPTFESLFFAGKLTGNGGDIFVLEIDIQKTGPGTKLSVRSPNRVNDIISSIRMSLMEAMPGLKFQ